MSEESFSYNKLHYVASQFLEPKSIYKIHELKNGNINRTFRIYCNYNYIYTSYILQQVNQKWLPKSSIDFPNSLIIHQHIQSKLNQEIHYLNSQRWDSPEPLKTVSGGKFYFLHNREYWRAFHFINPSLTISTVNSAKTSYQVGRGLAIFHNLIKDLDKSKIDNTFADFHDTPKYLNIYDSLIKQNVLSKVTPEKYLSQQKQISCFIKSNQGLAYRLNQPEVRSRLHSQLIHGDPKITNFLFDEEVNRCIAMIDFDTIYHGFLHYDLGDSIRSVCNVYGEELESYSDLPLIKFDLCLLFSFLSGYFESSEIKFKEIDYYYMPLAIAVLPYELGIRFFSDFLVGDQ